MKTKLMRQTMIIFASLFLLPLSAYAQEDPEIMNHGDGDLIHKYHHVEKPDPLYVAPKIHH